MPGDARQARLASILSQFAGKRILAIGDLMLDEFLWGRVSRISPEAPVPVVDITGESYYPGGAANVARNLREFTAGTSVMGRAGKDAWGERLMELLVSAGIDTSGIQLESRPPTIVKTRIIARHQQVVRVDREQKEALSPEQAERAAAYLDRAISEVDGVVVADYGKGFLTQALADRICEKAHAHGKVLTVDPHPHTSVAWHGATAIKPNRSEAFLAAGFPPSEPVSPVLADRALLEVGEKLRNLWKADNLLITLGEQGMLLIRDGAPPYHTPTRARDVFDVSGAGDTAIAVFTLGLASGATAPEAAELANVASGIVVGKLGTATVNTGEMAAEIERL